MTRVRDMKRLLDLAIKATSQGPEKWEASKEWIEIARPYCVQISEALLAAARWDTRQGGLTNQELKRAVAALPKVIEKEDAA